jgi:hypothetical protein
MQIEPPPGISEDTSAADLARRRLLKHKRLYLGLPRVSFLNALRRREKSEPEAPAEQTILSNDAAEIDLSDPLPDLDSSQDTYKWAVVYENQRGFALVSFVSTMRIYITCFLKSHHFFYRILLSPRTIPARSASIHCPRSVRPTGQAAGSVIT